MDGSTQMPKTTSSLMIWQNVTSCQKHQIKADKSRWLKYNNG